MKLQAEENFRKALISNIPRMRMFARALYRGQEQADDLVQESLLKAWQHRSNLQSLTSISSWLLVIMRNVFLNNQGRKKYEVEDIDGRYALNERVAPSQPDTLELEQLMKFLYSLPPQLREILVLVCVEGLSHKEAATICNCSVAAVKCRLSRGRKQLSALLNSELSSSASVRKFVAISRAA